MTNMYLDDLRTPSNDRPWTIVRSFDDAVEYVNKNGVPNFISFDHDLGDNVPTGFDFAKWLVKNHLDGNFNIPKNFEFNVHSANPPGKANIEGLMTPFIDFINS